MRIKNQKKGMRKGKNENGKTEYRMNAKTIKLNSEMK